MTRAIEYARHHAIAMLALLCSLLALAGASYAAVSLPAGSVGSKQLQNGSISPIKFDPHAINGSIRAWVVVADDGTVRASAGKPTVTVRSSQGAYNITWRVPTSLRLRCFATGGLTGAPGQVTVVASLAFDHSKPRPKKVWGVDVSTFDAQGQPVPESFYAALVC